MVDVKYDVILDELREDDSNISGILDSIADKLVFAIHESESGISNEFGTSATPATTVINNDGELVVIE